MKKRLLAVCMCILLMIPNTLTVSAAENTAGVQEAVVQETEEAVAEEETASEEEAVAEEEIAPEEEAVAEEETAPEEGYATAEVVEKAFAGSSMANATNISLGSTYSGSITESNTQNFYKFTLATSGTVSLTLNANFYRVHYELFNNSGERLRDSYFYWNSSSEQIVENEKVCLTSGTYYLKLSDSSYYGTYTFKAAFTSSGESFKETNGGGNNVISSASSISLNTTYKGQIAVNDEKDFYKFTLPTSGTVNLTMTANMKYIYCKIFDSSGKEVWSISPVWNSSSEQIVVDETICLTSGSYYLEMLKYGSHYQSYYYGNYTFKAAFTSSGESFQETNGGNNNLLSSADKISLNKEYKGQIAINDEKDFYQFTLSTADTVNIVSTAGIESLRYKIFDAKGEELSSTNVFWNSDTKKSNLNKSVELTAGIYYFEIEKYYSDSYGDYSFTIVSPKNINTVQPDKVNGAKIGGRASDALRLNWNKAGNADGYIIEQYKNGSWVRIARIGSGSTVTYRVAGLSASTTYKFRIKSFALNGNDPTYSSYAYINGKTNPSAVSGLYIKGTATDALRLAWNKNSSAEGYIIEQYKNGSWTRIARIGSNSTTEYRVEKLSASTTYKFRVKSFAFEGETALYSGYKEIYGATKSSSVSLTAVTGVKIGGRATDALRLNWSKNSSASGYIIEQYKNGAWTRIVRIAYNGTLTYRAEGLKASTTYKFRIKAFSFDGSTPVYSTYTNISGTTLPAAVTGLKIGGTAKDALRLNWNKNSSASGYIIEQYQNGSWVGIARIGNNSTVTYRVENLKSGSDYVFRIQSFGFDGSTPLYSSYQYVNGMTSK